MAKKTKKQVIENEVINAQIEAQIEAQEVTPTTEVPNEIAPEATEKSDLELAQDAVAQAKEAMKEAKRKLAEAKKSATKARPIRTSYFAVYVDGSLMYKSDVHYCAEKAVIDVLNESIKNGDNNESVYEIYKVKKSDALCCDENTAIDLLLIETLAIDKSTNQIVIE